MHRNSSDLPFVIAELDRRHGVGALVGCGTVEDGKKLRSKRVIDFDHVDGSRGLPRVSGDDEGLSWPRSCHGVCGARVSERVFLGSLHNRRSFSAWQL